MKAAKLAGALSPAVTSAGRREGKQMLIVEIADVGRREARRVNMASQLRFNRRGTHVPILQQHEPLLATSVYCQ